MRFGITVLGSGSQGNCIVLHTDTAGIMIDAGFSRKEIISRFGRLNIDTGIIKALLITHEHEDHIRGARVFADELGIPTYVTGETLRYMKQSGKTVKLGKKIFTFSPGTAFDIAGFRIEPFAVQHDAIEPVGFIVSMNGASAGVATDLGHLNMLAKQRLKGCDAIILESNHDKEMLWATKRPVSIIRRIMGRHGHLNNEDAISSFTELVTERTKCLFLAHLSSEGNCSKLVKNTAMEKLHEIGRTDILLKVLEQSIPTETVWV